MAKDRIYIKEQDLVLKVAKNVNKEQWDESAFDKFVIELTKGRKFQEEAIFTALRFMCGGQYNSVTDLAKENYKENEKLHEKYPTEDIFLKKLYFNSNYTANIDLATGTGKSWVLYGIAAVMLSAGFVDRVLVLVPSVTIEQELTKKFKNFASNKLLNLSLNSIPPKIINGNDSIVKGSICIENRDAVYKNSRSSITDCLRFKGDRTLVLNDEVHHIYYNEENEWKKFISLINPKFNIGVSGTCYFKDNDYFPNVIYRYSLKQAIEDGWIKNVNYVVKENMPIKTEEKWQVIINKHKDIKNRLKDKNILPISIVVTDKTETCDKIAKQFKEYLKASEKLSDDEANEKVIVVHSKPSAAADRLKLKSVDDESSKIEWIFSVSMLTEGWDVKRVFQIIPHEERAFNSKLLIAQVLGRGLRLPNDWKIEFGKPEVTVFNHEKWSSGVKKLVDEILEIERKISTKVISDSPFHFELIDCDYLREPNASAQKKQKVGIYNLFENGYVFLPSDLPEEGVEIELSDLSRQNKIEVWKTDIKHKTISVDDMALKMWDRFRDIPDDDSQNLSEQYQQKYTVEVLKDVIEKSLEKSGNKVITDKLANRLMASMSTAWRQGSTYITYNTKPDKFIDISTAQMRTETANAGSLKNSNTLFWTDDTENYLTDEEKEFFYEIADSGNGYKQKHIDNKNNFKTVTSLCFSNHEPERKFIEKLIENADYLSAWIKSPSTGFYSIDYSWKKNPRRGEAVRYDKFNPDFFIKVGKKIIVAEIKGDEEISNPQPENIGKYSAAVEHFNIINNYCKENIYKFTMVTPKSFDALFSRIRENTFDRFRSELDVSILEKSEI